MIEDEYEIVTIESSTAPEHMEGTGWHCYVIGQGPNRIRGYRQGSLAAVREAVEEIVDRLNERRFGKRGRVHLDMSSQGKAAKSK